MADRSTLTFRESGRILVHKRILMNGRRTVIFTDMIPVEDAEFTDITKDTEEEAL